MRALASTGILVAGFLILLFATDVGMSKGYPNPARTPRAITVVPEIDQAKWPDDPVRVHGLTVVDDTLRISVSLTGGCRAHSFRLVAASELAHTEPPAANVLLTHNGFGDKCVAHVPMELAFDLRPLREIHRAQSGDSAEELVLRFGSDELSYRF